jgi:hypothetical protein
MPKVTYPPISEAAHGLGCFIVGGIVDDDDLEILEGLVENTFDRRAQE